MSTQNAFILLKSVKSDYFITISAKGIFSLALSFGGHVGAWVSVWYLTVMVAFLLYFWIFVYLFCLMRLFRMQFLMNFHAFINVGILMALDLWHLCPELQHNFLHILLLNVCIVYGYACVCVCVCACLFVIFQYIVLLFYSMNL